MATQTTDGQRGAHRMHARFIPVTSSRVPSLPPLPPPADLPAARRPQLLDQVRHVIRFQHYSYQTEKTYIHWIKRFIFFHRTIQELLGHRDVSTTMIYTHVLNRGGRGVASPADRL